MDYEVLKSLLHTPPGKLARWGMALQELDLTIEQSWESYNILHITLYFLRK